MKRYKFGFTLAEVLVSVVVIGVIMALSVNSIKIVKSSYTSLAYFAYNNVVNMVGVLNAGASGNDAVIDNNGHALPSMVAQCRTSGGNTVQVLKSDKEYYNDQGTPFCSKRKELSADKSNLFCKSLVAISNTSGATNCDNLFTTNLSSNTEVSAYEEPYINNLDHNNPTFIATNGQRYYVSEWEYNEKVSKIYGYRLIAVDLNGTSRPNKTDRESVSSNPDVVTFLVLDNGEVFPLGVAATNRKLDTGRMVLYLNSKVKGYYYNYNPERTENVAPECTQVIKGVKKQTCNYAIVYLQNEEGASFFNYREAYCKTLGGYKSAYEGYCTGITPSEYCPPSSNAQAFDLCTTTNVKPMFRYNFN